MTVPFKVVCKHGNPLFGECMGDWNIKKGEIYTVVATNEATAEFKLWGLYFELSHQPEVYYPHENFEIIQDNQYPNSVSKKLAEKAMNVGDGADQPIKIKEPALS